MGEIKNYELKLTAVGPVFIGSNTSYGKKEYLSYRSGTVCIINTDILVEWAAKSGHMDAFENFMLCEPGRNLLNFFEGLRADPNSIKGLVLYKVDSGAALFGDRTAEIKAFIKNPSGAPYIPGSSLKGALRTVILTKMLREKRGTLPALQVGDKNASHLTETMLLNTLNRHRNTPNALNSIMSAILISDSESISPERLTLNKKTDISRDGFKNQLNTIRETLRPGTEAKMVLSVKPEAGKLDAKFIADAIKEFYPWYSETYMSKFKGLPSIPEEDTENAIFLGGGCGYFAKNIVYPYMEYPEAVRSVSQVMARKFSQHRHERDIEIGISPHMAKYTDTVVNGRSVPMPFGLCRAEIKEIA